MSHPALCQSAREFDRATVRLGKGARDQPDREPPIASRNDGATPLPSGFESKGTWRMADSSGVELASGPMTARRYLDSLKDGREVWIDGERVADVTTHPAFADMVG